MLRQIENHNAVWKSWKGRLVSARSLHTYVLQRKNYPGRDWTYNFLTQNGWSNNQRVNPAGKGSNHPGQSQNTLLHMIMGLNYDISSISQANPGSVAPQLNLCSTTKSKKKFHNINGSSGMPVSMGKRPSQRDVSLSINQSIKLLCANIPGKARFSGTTAKSVFNSKKHFLEVATVVAEQTDSGRLFQRDGAQEWKALAPALVLTLRTRKLIPFSISVNGMGVMWQAWSEDKQPIFLAGFYRSANWSWAIL